MFNQFMSKYVVIFLDPETGGSGGGEAAAAPATTTEAPAEFNLDSAAARLTEVYNNARNRDEATGKFTAKSTEAATNEDEEKVVDIATGKPPEKGDAEAEAETGEDDEDLEFEVAAEEGKEPVRRKLSELWDAYEEAQTLKTEVEKLKTQAQDVPAEYTQSMQETIQARSQYLHGLELVSKFLQPQPPSKTLVDPNHHDYNPEAYYAQLQKFEQDSATLQAVNKEREQLSKQQEEQHNALVRAHLAREQQAAARAWPEFTKPETQQEIRSTLKDVYGFTDEEIGNIPDHRQMLVIRDAIQFRKMQAEQKKAVKVVRQKPKLVKGAARKTTDAKATARTNAMSRLQQTGSMDAAAAALKDLI